ncbi:MAG: SLC13 family permease [Desulfuromonas sp.]|nr:MAG: SLC13 family permease [Desulfuromonas sp.]
MSLAAIFTLLVVAMMLVGLVLELFAPDVIVFSALGVLLVAGIVTPAEALSGFSNAGMLTVAILFVVAFAAQSSGILELFAQKVMGTSGGGRRSLLRLMLPVLTLSAFLNNTPIVAMFTPTVRDWALRRRLAPSKFLIPLSYASIFGGACTLIGTSTNLVVNGLYQQATGSSLAMFELAWIGVPCALAGIVFFLLVGFRLLPNRADLSEQFDQAGREYLLEMRIPEGSPLIGLSVDAAGLRQLDQLYLAEIVRAGHVLVPVKPQEKLLAGDHLIFSGQLEGVVRLQKITGLALCEEGDYCSEMFKSGRGRILEAVVSRSSPMLGKSIREGGFRSRYDAAVLAVHRHGERITSGLGQLELRPGDTLLLLAGSDFFKRWKHSRDFYMVSKVGDAPVVNRRKTLIALVALSGMILLSASGILPILHAAILAALVLLLSRSVTAVEARRSIELNVLVVIAAALGISKALEKTGAADALAQLVIQAVDGLGPLGLLAAIYIVTSIMTEVVTNNAAAALAFPIALSAAAQAGYDPRPFVIAIAVAASASFATPIGYQTNLMVYGPGGYRFTDFLKVGIPINLLFMTVCLILVPLVWSF